MTWNLEGYELFGTIAIWYIKWVLANTPTPPKKKKNHYFSVPQQSIIS